MGHLRSRVDPQSTPVGYGYGYLFETPTSLLYFFQNGCGRVRLVSSVIAIDIVAALRRGNVGFLTKRTHIAALDPLFKTVRVEEVIAR